MRLGGEAHRLPPPLEHQGHRLALVGPHAMRALHEVARSEAPRARHLPVGRVVAAQHEGRPLLRGLYRRYHEPRALEHHVHRGGREVERVAQPEAPHGQKHVLPQGRDRVSPLQLRLRHGHDRELDPARAEALRQWRRDGPARVPRPRAEIAARQLTHGAQQRHDEVARRRPFVLEESWREQREPAPSHGRRDEAVRRRRGDGGLERIAGRLARERRAGDAAERRPRHGGGPAQPRGRARAQPVPRGRVLDLEDAAHDGTVGVQHHHEPHRDPSPNRVPRFERRDERPSRQAAHRDRSRDAHRPVAGGRTIRVRVARVAAVLEPQHVVEALARPAVVQGERPRGLERDLDPVIHERATLHRSALARRPAGRLGERQPGDPHSQPGHRRRAKRHAQLVHFVAVRIVPHRVEALGGGPPVEQLDGDGASVGADQRDRPIPLADAHRPTGRAWADEDVAPEHGDVHHDDPPPRPRRGVPQHERRPHVGGALARDVGIVAHQLVHAAPHQLRPQRFHLREPRRHRPRHVVAGAPRQRVVELALRERPPGQLEQRPAVAAAVAPGQGGERLGAALEQQLGRRIAALQRGTGRVHALQRPRVPVRPA